MTVSTEWEDGSRFRLTLDAPRGHWRVEELHELARTIADASDLSGPALHELTYGYARRQWQRRGFYRMLSAMLFRAAEPEERYRILERFYRLDAGLIARFYASQSSLLDRARVLVGKPPVPMGRAVRAIRGSQ